LINEAEIGWNYADIRKLLDRKEVEGALYGHI